MEIRVHVLDKGILPTNTRATRAFHGLLCLWHDGARYEWQAHRGTMENYQKIEKVGEGMSFVTH